MARDRGYFRRVYESLFEVQLKSVLETKETFSQIYFCFCLPWIVALIFDFVCYKPVTFTILLPEILMILWYENVYIPCATSDLAGKMKHLILTEIAGTLNK